MSEPAPRVATVEEEEEEEEEDMVPPPSKLGRLQTMETWEDIKDWQYTSANASDPLPYVDMSSQLAGSAPVETQSKGLSLEAMAPPPMGGQVYFPVPGVVPAAFAQHQPVQMMQPMGQPQMPMGQQMQPMMQRPMTPPMESGPGGYPGQGPPMQPMQPMQPNVPVVFPGWQP